MPYAVAMSSFDIQAAIGQNLRRIRVRAAMTQEAFAQRLGTDQSSLSLWESGARLPRLKELTRRLEEAGLDPRELLVMDGSTEPPDPDIARAVAALRDLPVDVRGTIAGLAETLRRQIPREYDGEVADLLSMLARIDPSARVGILTALRQLVSSLPMGGALEDE